MGYRLKEDEAFPKGIKRIVEEQVEKALDNLKPTIRNKDEAIHDARVCVKKIRAILLMIRDSLGNKTYDEEDTAYRDVARLLSKVRDSTAMIETLDKLTTHYSDQLSEDAFAGVRKRLRRTKTAQKNSAKSAMSQAAKSLRKVSGNIKRWPKPAAGETIALGLKRVYKTGRKSFNDAYDKRTVETFHEWRKQVKHLLYQTRVLAPLWGRMMNALTDELDALGEFLSEHHDLAILRDRLAAQLSGPENQVEIETLVALIDQRQNEFEILARRLGARIYAESPDAFVSRSEVYWQTLRSEIKDEPIVLS